MADERHVYRVVGGLLRAHPRLAVIAIGAAGVQLLLVVAVFAGLLTLLPTSSLDDTGYREYLPAVLGFVPFVILRFPARVIATACGVAIASAAGAALDGRRPSVSGAVRVSLVRLPRVLGWSLVTSDPAVALRWAGGLRRGRATGGDRLWQREQPFAVSVLALTAAKGEAVGAQSRRTVSARWGDGLGGAVVAARTLPLAACGPLIVGGMAWIVAGVSGSAVAWGVTVACGVATAATWVTFIVVTRLVEVAVYRYATLGPGSAGGFTDADLDAGFRLHLAPGR